MSTPSMSTTSQAGNFPFDHRIFEMALSFHWKSWNHGSLLRFCGFLCADSPGRLRLETETWNKPACRSFVYFESQERTSRYCSVLCFYSSTIWESRYEVRGSLLALLKIVRTAYRQRYHLCKGSDFRQREIKRWNAAEYLDWPRCRWIYFQKSPGYNCR